MKLNLNALTANTPSAILKTRNDKKTCQNVIESCQKLSSDDGELNQIGLTKGKKSAGGVRPFSKIEREAVRCH